MTPWVPVASGILVGAVSGIGGAVAGAWMNRKSQIVTLRLNISAEENRIRLTEKRRLYAQVIEKVTELSVAIEAYSEQIGKSDSQIKSEYNHLELTVKSFTNTANETSLIAPEYLNTTIGMLHERLSEYIRKVHKGTRNIKAQDETQDLADKIIREMRKNLGT